MKQMSLPMPINTALDLQAANEADGHPSMFAERERTDPFYKLPGWRRARMAVFARDGARCRDCGKTAQEAPRLDVHHVVPRSEAPELGLYLSNLIVLCEGCHEMRHYKMSLRRLVGRVAMSQNRR